MAAAVLPAAAPAGASHPRPAASGALRASLVTAFAQCIGANRTHGPPLASPACHPPAQTSSSITVGTTDANGAAATMTGSVRIAPVVGVPGPPEDSDVRLVAALSDVRCVSGTTACGAANAAGGPDYTGELQLSTVIRITDHFNASGAGGGTDPATVADLPLPVNLPCAATGSTSTGASCSVSTTLDAVIPPDAARDGKRAVVAIHQVQVLDGGPDGAMTTTPNALFAVQGLFVP